MRVRMLRNAFNFGVTYDLATFEAGKSYDLPEALAIQYLNLGYAIEDKMLDPPEVK